MTSLLVLSNDLAAYLFNHAASPPYVYSDSDIESQDPILSPRAVRGHQILRRDIVNIRCVPVKIEKFLAEVPCIVSGI